MKHTLLFATIASILALGTAHASSIVTSQTYVDNRDALKVDIAQGVGTNNANVGKTLVVNSSGNLELGTPASGNYVEDSITDGVTNKAPSENAVHDALEDKQDTIDTGLVSLGDEWIEDLPAVVSYDTTSGLVGNKYGILDYNGSVDYVDDGWHNYQEDNETNHLIPTVGAVGRELQNIWGSMPSPITWNSNDATAVNNYSTSFTGTGNWPSEHEDRYVTGSSLVQGLALKQNRQIGASPVGNANSIDAGKVLVVGNDGKIAMGTTMPDTSNFQTKIPASEWVDVTIPGVIISTDADGVVEQRMILDKTQDITEQSIDAVVANGYDDGDRGGIVSDIFDNTGALVTADDVNNAVPTTTMTIAIAKSAASPKQNRQIGAAPVGNANSTDAGKVLVVDNNGEIDMGTVPDNVPTNSSTNLVTSGGVYTAVNAKQTKKTCAGWLDGTTVPDATHTDANCVLWNLPD